MSSSKHLKRAATARKVKAEPILPDPSDSDNSETVMVSRLAQKMLASSKKRRETRRNELKAEFGRRCTAVEKTINTSFDTSTPAGMQGKLERLDTLLTKKREIEEEIMKRLKVMEKAYMDANQELSITMAGRIDDMKGMEDRE